MSTSRISLSIVIVLALSSHSFGQAVQPCSDGLVGEGIIPLTNLVMDYCVSDFGWSDAYLLPPQQSYNQFADVLSGEDAANLYFEIGGNQASGTGWLTPGMDAGALFPVYATGSPV